MQPDTGVWAVLQVLAYLQAFADAFDLHKHIQLNTTVMRVDPVLAQPAAAAEEEEVAGQQEVEACSMPDVVEAAAGISTGTGSGSSSGKVFPLTPGQEVKWRVVTQSSMSSSSSDCKKGPSTACSSLQKQPQENQKQQQQQQQQEWLFDAVAVCVGIFSEPNLPQVRPNMSSCVFETGAACLAACLQQ
jgi:hypothetical protein